LVKPEVFNKLAPYLQNLLADKELSSASVRISGRVLTSKEAIGSPGRDDFPLQKGKEKLMQAVVDGFAGQAFTDMPGEFEGVLEEIFSLPPADNYRRAAIIATLNAVMRKQGKISGTVHCKDSGPGKCSSMLIEMIRSEYGKPKIAMIGFQPAMADLLTRNFDTRIFDLDPDNIGKDINGTRIESGNCSLDEVEAWCDLMLVTGSTIVNGSIDAFLETDKPVIFYGTTIAGAADILGLKRFCPVSL